jgi:hypothetical protein
VFFLENVKKHFDGRCLDDQYLDPQFIAHPDRPPNKLFRWHFRQAVLANMKGAGEPNFEHDFPPGSDMLGDIRDGPKAAERMEFEFCSVAWELSSKSRD